MEDTELAEQLRSCVVRNASCVLADAKPASLFNFIPRLGASAAMTSAAFRHQSHRVALHLNQSLMPLGIRLDVLVVSGMRALMLASRPQRLEQLLGDPQVCSFLTDSGYTTENEGRVISCLRRRLRSYELSLAAEREAQASDPCDGCAAEAHACPKRNPWRAELAFPHEVGVILGYPLQDVQGFIEHQGANAVAVGTWKVYGDVEGARARWERLRACERSVMVRYEQGATLEELIA